MNFGVTPYQTQTFGNSVFELPQQKSQVPIRWTDHNPDIQLLLKGNIPERNIFSFEETEAAADIPFNQILPGLYLGNVYGAGRILGRKSPEALEKKKNALLSEEIKMIVCCTENSEHFFSENEFQYIDIPLIDHDVSLSGVINDKIIATIDEKIDQGGVLIHCAAGMSRSASITILYLAKKFPHLSYEQIFNFVNSKRICVQPNTYFENQLRQIISK